MRKIILFLSLIFSILGWANEKIVIVGNSGSSDSIFVMEYSIDKSLITPIEKYAPSEYIGFKTSTLVLYSWNAETDSFEMKVNRLHDWEYTFNASSLGGSGASVNSEHYVAWNKNDTEIDCENDESEFILVNLENKKYFSVSTDDRFFMKYSQNLENLRIAYYDAYPRGAGTKEFSVLLNVFDLANWKVRTIKEFPELNNLDTIGREYPLWGVSQWLSLDIISYMTIEKTISNAYILRLYTCNLNFSEEANLLISFEFLYSIAGFDYQIFDGKVYIKNMNSIYVLTEKNTIKEVYKQENGCILGFEIEHCNNSWTSE